MKNIYVALLRGNDKWKTLPIVTSDDINVIKRELDEYFNITVEYEKSSDTKNKCLGFTYNSVTNISDYKGYYLYEEVDIDGLKNTNYVDIYCSDYINN